MCRFMTITLALMLAFFLHCSTPEASAQGLPSAESLFQAHVQAIGGREAMERHRNRIVYGSIDFEGGGTQILVIHQQAPNKLLYTVESPGQFTITRAFDGESAWGIDQTGQVITINPTSDEGRDIRFNAVFLGDAAYETQYTSMRTTERGVFNNRPIFAVDVTTFTGLSQRILFDQETRLIIGKVQVVEGTGGAAPGEMVFNYDEYTEFEGVRLVTRQRQTLRGRTNVVNTHFVEVNNENMVSFTRPEMVQSSAAAELGG